MDTSTATAVSKPKTNLGVFAILAKLGPKLLSILGKFLKVFGKLIKGAAGLKGVGAAASIGVYTLLFSWQMAIALVLFIFVHEYGHYSAMKWCGIKTKGIYLIPGFGGAAVAAEGFKSNRNEAFIGIMGPIYGALLMIPAMILFFITKQPMFIAIVSFYAAITIFNLFPINPLDGGRIVKSLLYSFKASAGFFFSILSFLSAIFIAYSLNLGLIGFIGIIGLLEMITEYGIGSQLKRILKTIMRGVVILFLIKMMPLVLRATDALSIILFTGLGTLIFMLFLIDVADETGIGDIFDLLLTALKYPYFVVRDFFLGLKELTTIKPGTLKRKDEFKMSMTKKQTLFYGLLYLALIAAMVFIVIYASRVPGCEHAKQMLT